MADTKTTNGMFNLMDGSEPSAGELITEQNLNWQTAENQIKANTTNISLLEATGLSQDVVNGQRVFKRSGIVTFMGYVRNTIDITSAYHEAFTLPVGFRPIVNTYFSTNAITYIGTITIYISTAGVVQIRSESGTLPAGRTFDFSISYATG